MMERMGKSGKLAVIAGIVAAGLLVLVPEDEGDEVPEGAADELHAARAAAAAAAAGSTSSIRRRRLRAPGRVRVLIITFSFATGPARAPAPGRR